MLARLFTKREGELATTSRAYVEIPSVAPVSKPSECEKQLVAAINNNQAKLVESLLDKGARTSHSGESVLHVATKSGHSEIVELLLKRGYPVDSTCKEGLTCSQYAVWNDDVFVLRKLLNHGADINISCQNFAPLLIGATYRENLRMVRLLLEYGADPSLANEARLVGASALHIAAEKGLVCIAHALLEAGADPLRAAQDGHTPLSAATDITTQNVLKAYMPESAATWIMRELLVRGVAWNAAAPVAAIMTREGFVSRAAQASVPLDDFTPAYLTRIRITGLGLQHMLREIRLRSTYLGERLHHAGVSAKNLELCENTIITAWSRTSEELFASLKVSDMSVSCITSRHVEERLRELYQHLNEKFEFSKRKKDGVASADRADPLKQQVIAPHHQLVVLVHMVDTPILGTTAPADLLTF